MLEISKKHLKISVKQVTFLKKYTFPKLKIKQKSDHGRKHKKFSDFILRPRCDTEFFPSLMDQVISLLYHLFQSIEKKTCHFIV